MILNNETIQKEILNPERLNALREMELLDTPPEPVFDRISRVASKLLRSPVAVLSLVEHHRQFFKSTVGFTGEMARCCETPLSHSFCKYVVASKAPLMVDDAHNHPVVKGNPAICDNGVIAYLGVPLFTGAGFVIGSFCVIDLQPRQWSSEDLQNMTDLAAALMSEFGHRAELSMRRKHETAFKSLERRLRLSLEEAGIAEWSFCPDSDKIIGSSLLPPLFGHPGDREIGTLQRLIEHLDAHDAQELINDLSAMSVKRGSQNSEHEKKGRVEGGINRKLGVLHDNGSRRLVRMTGHACRDPFGRLESISGLCQDAGQPADIRPDPTILPNSDRYTASTNVNAN